MQDMSNISAEKTIHAKRVILFSTRFLENDTAFFKESTTVKKAFLENESYCEFFLNNNANDELKHYLYDEYVIPHLKKHFPEDVGSDVITFQKALEPLKSKYPSLYNTIRGERRRGYPHVFNINKYLSQDNDNNTDNEKDVPKKDLLSFILSCTKEDVKKIKLDIDCDLSSYEITWRFKLYKLQLPENCGYSAYAVWSLNELISHDEFKWYEALCKEILNQEKGNEIEKIYLFLHDKDITSSTFKVRHYNKTNEDSLFSYLQDRIKLYVALFQHNDLIGKILSSSPSNDEEKIELLSDASNVMENIGNISFLYELSDCISRWTKKNEKNKTGREEYLDRTTADELNKFPDITLKYTNKNNNVDNISVLLIYNDVKEQIDSLIKATT